MPVTSNSKPAEQFLEELGMAQLPVNGGAGRSSLFANLYYELIYENQDVFLFDCAIAAKEVAWMVRGTWDGCNGVLLKYLDKFALETAIELVGTTYCRSGNCCYLPESIQLL